MSATWNSGRLRIISTTRSPWPTPRSPQRAGEPARAVGVVGPGPLAPSRRRPSSAGRRRRGRRRRSRRSGCGTGRPSVGEVRSLVGPHRRVLHRPRWKTWWTTVEDCGPSSIPMENVGAFRATSSPREIVGAPGRASLLRLSSGRSARSLGRSSSASTASVSAPRDGPRGGPARRPDSRATALHHDAVDLDEHVARQHVRVGEQVGHRVHGRDRGLAPPRTRRAPRRDGRAPTHARDDRVELLAVLGAARRTSRSAGRRRRRELEHAVRDRLGRRRDRDPLAVGALVGAARHGVRDAGAEAGLLVAEVRGRRRQRRHHLQHRLEQVHVDDLALAGAVAVRAARPSPRTRPRARRPRR